MSKFDKIRADMGTARSEYGNNTSGKKRYRYTVTGIVAILVALLILLCVWEIVKTLTDNRILKPGEVDFANEHTPVFIDESSEDSYLESGLFAPAVVEDFTKLESGYIIESGPVANLVKNYCKVFATGDEADPSFLLSFGIWEALYEDVYNSKGVVEDKGTTYISYEVVDAAIKEYFEMTELPAHQNSVDVFGTFTADDDRQAYKAETTGFEDSLVARVVSVTSTTDEKAAKDKDGKDVKEITTYVDLTVDCISSGDEVEYETNNGAEPAVYSTYLIKIRVDPDGSYKFLSVTDPNAQQSAENTTDTSALVDTTAAQ